jgi:hypothetical protein
MDLLLDQDPYSNQPVAATIGQVTSATEPAAEAVATAPTPAADPRRGRHDALLAALRSSELFDAQLEALPRPESADAVEAAVRALLESNGVAPLSIVAQRAGKPATRAAGFAVTLQRLFNYDQVEVLEITDGNRMLRLNAELLRRQFDLPGAG